MSEALQYPVSVEKLYTWIPHRPPMIWIDEVLSINSSEGECQVRLKKDALYIEGGRLKPSTVIEWMAQAYGYVEACRAFTTGAKPLSKAFLVSLKGVEFANESILETLSSGSMVRIHVKTVTQVGPFSIVDGRVVNESNGDCLGSAQLKLYGER